MQNPYGYNPMIYTSPYAPRMQQGGGMPTYYPQPQQTPGVAASMVTNRQEAEAAQIPFDSSMSIFADVAHGCIYTKRFNPQTGSADFCVYRAEQAEAPAEPEAPAYASAQEVADLRKQIEELTDRLDRGRRARREDDE